MSVALYMDVHIPRAVTLGLRMRDVDVLTAQEDYAARVDDATLLTRATVLGRVLVTQDKDFLAIGADWQRRGVAFAGVVYAPQAALTIGELIRDLELIGRAGEPVDFENRVEFLPL